MPVRTLITCPVSGLEAELPGAGADGEPTFEARGEDDDVLRPPGWARLDFRVSVPNPEYHRIRAFHATARAQIEAGVAADPEVPVDRREEVVAQHMAIVEAEQPLPDDEYGDEVRVYPALSPEAVRVIRETLKTQGVDLG